MMYRFLSCMMALKIKGEIMSIARVLTIAGSDSGGGAGIQADLKTIMALGAYGTSAITALTAQNTLGVLGVLDVGPEFVRLQIDAVLSDIGADAVKTGMLLSAGVVHVVSGSMREYGVKALVVDPVMLAKDGSRLLRPDAEDALVRELLPLAYLVTPNIPEAEKLAGMHIATADDMHEAARRIRKLGPGNVLVKGGHLEGNPVDVLFDGTDFITYSGVRIDTGDSHGTGCTLSSAIAALLALGRKLPEAVEGARSYLVAALQHSQRLGRGNGPLDHMAPIRMKNL
jgi:hydroxymethylpyrimidine/phosphomethylpyrimidine kinase